jgi:DNA modification methylase
MSKALRHSLDVKMTAIGDLVPWARNPRINDAAAERLAYTIQEHGWTTPLLAQAGTNRIIGGHTRLKAALKIGLTEVPVVFLDVDDTQADSIAIADNRMGELAEWDNDELARILEDIEADGGDLLAIGYNDADWAELLESLDAKEPLELELPGDVEPDEPPAEPVSKRGEVYELGPHRLICGDCRESSDVALLLGGRKVNVAFTSPPYASQRKYDETSGFKPIPPDEYVEWFDAVQANVREHLAEDGSWFVNIKEHCEDGQRSLYVKDLTIAHVRMWGWMFVDEMIWLRSGVPGHPLKMGYRFKNGFEPVFHFTSTKNPKMRPDAVAHASNDAISYKERESKGPSLLAAGGRSDNLASTGAGMAFPSNVLSLKGVAKDIGHSAAFPVALPDFFILAFSDLGDAIFDPFLGSGTTLIAAAQNKRVAFGCEISEGYCDVIRRRWTKWAKEAGKDPGAGALD